MLSVLTTTPGFTSNLTTISTQTHCVVSPVAANIKLPSRGPETVFPPKLGVKGDGSSDRHWKSHKNTHPTGVRKRVWKENKRVRRMVLGSDVGLEETCRLALCGLVGRLSYSYLANSHVSDWIVKTWVPILGYAPEILYLTKGWMGFICKTPEDASLLLSKFWVLGGSSLMLKRWRVAFDP
jgi:hypothetical protein